jgi:anti-sigma regulatory factor (Ser/Thr protein kinase)
MQAPYLFRSGGNGEPTPSVTTTSDVGTEVLEVAVHGQWGVRLRQEVYRGIYKCLAEHPAALLVDLDDLSDPGGLSLAMWLAARRAAMLLEPPVRLALCVPAPSILAARLRRIGAPSFLSTFASPAQARAALAGSLPMPDVLQRHLPPDVSSPSLARDLVGQACDTWRLPQLVYPARLVISELASNAVEHAGTDLMVTVSRRDTVLYLSVRDGDPHLPELLDPPPVTNGHPSRSRGRGLHLVHAAASAWGARPTADGKVVWATVRSGRTSTSER